MRNSTRRCSFRPISALTFGALLAGCEHPVQLANGPTPRQVMVAEGLNVPVSTVQALDREGLPALRAAAPRPDPSSPEAQRLRRELESLARAQSSREDATP